MHDCYTHSTADAEKRQAALSSVLWSFLLTILKLAAGLATNSLGMLSEALHSALDLVAAGITYCAVRVAARPANREHPYGYGKVENLSALAETILLLATCVWIVYEAVDRLFFAAPEIVPSGWAIVVILISIAVDVSRASMLKRVAKKYNSQALEADALHFSTDILSSVVVLLGLLAVWGASLLPEGPLRDWLEKTDALAALVVSAIVVWVGTHLCRRAVRVLLDGGGSAYAERLEQALASQLPLYTITRLRVRESGAEIFADLTLSAPGSLTLECAHDITRMVEDIAHDVMPGADLTVHVEPAAQNERDLLAIVHSVAQAHGLSVHSLALEACEDGLSVCLHVEAPGAMPLHEAHTLVDAFEAGLNRRIKAARIVSHIEPVERHAATEAHTPAATTPLPEVADAVRNALAVPPALPEGHDLEARNIAGLCALSLHCSVPSSLSVAEAHTLSTAMERRIRTLVPGLDRIIIHTEPQDGQKDAQQA